MTAGIHSCFVRFDISIGANEILFMIFDMNLLNNFFYSSFSFPWHAYVETYTECVYKAHAICKFFLFLCFSCCYSISMSVNRSKKKRRYISITRKILIRNFLRRKYIANFKWNGYFSKENRIVTLFLRKKFLSIELNLRNQQLPKITFSWNKMSQ